MCVCVLGIQILSAATGSARVCALSATAKDNTHTKNGSQGSVIGWAGGGSVEAIGWTPDWEYGPEKGPLLWFVRGLVKLSRMMHSTSADTFMSSASKMRHDSEGYVCLCVHLLITASTCFASATFVCRARDIYWPAVESLCST